MTHLPYIVIFDGTSAYVIPSSELTQEIENNDAQILGSYANFDEACDFCDKENDVIIDHN
jgi:hypothetical protein